ncbi:hypothetical protein JXC34_03445, partial [Candidatus Woesearchaeota archaeon]|nr:hypothetical protein [Candidatus Woesearchaeota archaeon]
TFGPRHSLETQLMRQGVSRPVKNVSVGGIILTSPEKNAPKGYLVLGVRGGAAFPNTYHINAGALKATDGFKKGLSSVYDVFRTEELEREFGLSSDELDYVHVHSRIYDPVIDKGPMYVFCVQTNLIKDELYERWQNNLDPDKSEHDSPHFILAGKKSVADFVRQTYKGVVRNKQDRVDSERYLLSPGAFTLAAYAGKTTLFLKRLYRQGVF